VVEQERELNERDPISKLWHHNFQVIESLLFINEVLVSFLFTQMPTDFFKSNRIDNLRKMFLLSPHCLAVRSGRRFHHVVHVDFEWGQLLCKHVKYEAVNNRH